MTIQFYRKKNKDTGREDLYEVGTDKYISPSSFNNGRGYSELKSDTVQSPRANSIADYVSTPHTNFRKNQKFIDIIKEAIKKKQGYNKDIQSAKTYWRTQQRDPITFTNEKLRLLSPAEQQAIRERRYATAGANLQGLREEEKYREAGMGDILSGVADIQNAKYKDSVEARQALASKISALRALDGTGYKLDNGSITRDYSGTTAKQLAAAIKRAESGGNYSSGGGSGESGAYQYRPDTWEQYTKEYTTDVLGAPQSLTMTPENQDKVTEYKIQKWLDAGYTPQQIASMWNAGEGRPDAYAQNFRGVNDFGVKYDTPAYVERVMRFLDTNKGQQKHVTWTPSAIRALAQKIGKKSSELLNYSDDKLDELAGSKGVDLIDLAVDGISPRKLLLLGIGSKALARDILSLKYEAGATDDEIRKLLPTLGVNVKTPSGGDLLEELTYLLDE